MVQIASKLQGQTFGKLIALQPTTERNHAKAVMWLCKCLECGKEVTVSSIKLKEGVIKSCGCLEHTRPARTPKGYSGFKSVLSQYITGAKSRSLTFNLTESEFKSLVTSTCTYCGTEPSQVSYGSQGAKKEYGKFIYNGIDRVDNKLGYSMSNCVTCCRTCNLAKHTMSIQEFDSWIQRVYSHRNFVNT